MTNELEQELRKIGLSEKEAKVYLAALELGPATAQNIAAKAIIGRPNTYIMIESLIKRGLITPIIKGVRRYFQAGSPTHLKYMLENQRREINEKEQVVAGIMEKLKINMSSAINELSVQVFEGLEGIVASQEDALSSDADELMEVVDLEQVRKYLPKRFPGDIRNKIISKYSNIRCLVNDETTFANDSPNKKMQLRYLERSAYPIGSDIVIYGNTVSFSDYTNKIHTVIIRNQSFASTMRIMFEILWRQGKERIGHLK